MRRALLLLLALAAAAALTSAVRAQPTEDSAQPSLEALQKKLAALEDERDQAHRDLEDLRAKSAKQLAEDREKVELLARAVVKKSVARSRLRAQVDALRAETQSAGPEAGALAKQRAEAESGLRALRDNLAVLLGEQPASDALAERLAAKGQPSADAVLEVLDAVLDRAGRVSLRRAEIRTAQGSKEEADLLDAGLMAHAYRTVRDGRYGLALASPAEASGYRWSESAGAAHADAIAAAIAAVREGKGPIDVPLDATRRIRAGSKLEQWDLQRLFLAGGPLMWPLLAIAVLVLLVVAERTSFLLRQGGTSESLVQRVASACRGGDAASAVTECERSKGVVARALAACLRRRNRGRPAMEDGFQEQLLSDLPRLQRFLSGLATLAAVAPLLGLLGTVTGIIQTFGVIQLYGNAHPGLLAGGISQALFTTAAGLIIAIPALLAHSFLSGRVDLLVSATEKGAAEVLNAYEEGERACAT